MGPSSVSEENNMLRFQVRCELKRFYVFGNTGKGENGRMEGGRLPIVKEASPEKREGRDMEIRGRGVLALQKSGKGVGAWK